MSSQIFANPEEDCITIAAFMKLSRENPNYEFKDLEEYNSVLKAVIKEIGSLENTIDDFEMKVFLYATLKFSEKVPDKILKELKDIKDIIKFIKDNIKKVLSYMSLSYNNDFCLTPSDFVIVIAFITLSYKIYEESNKIMENWKKPISVDVEVGAEICKICFEEINMINEAISLIEESIELLKKKLALLARYN